ncbi:MAG: tetratricopeptide repeat protein [Wenzhouxiangellaceae bacterium]
MIEADPGNAGAHAGLANTLAQRVVRWPSGQATVARERQSVTSTLASERLRTPWARSTLAEARRLARRAAELDPENPETHKSLGLVRSLQDDRTGARQAYEDALRLNPGLWSALVNLAELDLLEGDRRRAIHHFEAAWDAMQSEYAQTPQRIGSWLAELGVLLGELYKAEGQPERAEQWFRRVLETQPWHGDATLGLAYLLRERGETREAESLCGELALRIGPEKRCEAFYQ